jgi:hypothetical protein
VLHGQANRTVIQKWLGVGFIVVPDAVLEAGSAAAAQKNVEDVEDEEDEEDEEDGLETTYGRIQDGFRENVVVRWRRRPSTVFESVLPTPTVDFLMTSLETLRPKLSIEEIQSSQMC